MSKRKDMLRDKLNALKPSIPTNTRAVRETGTNAQPATKREKPAKRKPAEDPAGIKINIPEKDAAAAVSQPDLKQGPKEAKGRLGQEKRFSFDYAFIYSDLMQENLASFNRIRDVIVGEANNMNNMYIKSCWKSLEIGCEAIRKTCGLFTPFPIGKWPFQF